MSEKAGSMWSIFRNLLILNVLRDFAPMNSKKQDDYR